MTNSATTDHAAQSPVWTAHRLVLKIGSTLLVDQTTGLVRRVWLDGLVEDISAARRRGQEVAVVTSGAVALGRRALGLGKQRLKLGEKQAAAAAGQIALVQAWQESLTAHGIAAAQVLLTLDDSENRRRYLNARNTFETLFRLGAVPVINENDTVATEELRFGDNDRLAARVAEMIAAEALVLFSDIDGLYTADPHIDETAVFVPEVRVLTSEIDAMAGTSASSYGSGGMVTKLRAARICMNASCRMAIASGHPLRPVQALNAGGRCTWFMPETERHPARKRWIGGALRAGGTLTVDDGAVIALRNGSSLLPSGVVALEGNFKAGETVLVCNRAGVVVARGLVAYAAHEAARILGRHTSEIATVLGYRGREELIHRDDLVLAPAREG
ncbi:MAG: glutamate 5-kinase [Rhodospirillaceae bacterium]|nr:MAG: glutamate 5-kinase [Rhodospirillaceae bacterium]